MLKIIYSPSKYIQGADEIKNLASYYQNLGKKGAYILVDQFIYDNYHNAIISSFTANKIPIHTEVFTGECSNTEIHRNAEQIKSKGMDVVIAIGGGKTIDTGKACAYYTDLPIMVVPTIASSDAPCSALSAIYSETEKFEKYLYLKANPNAVIMDTKIIVNAPVRLLVAGMGDALSTYYEAQACADSSAITKAGGTVSNTALALAKLCLDTLFNDGVKAVAACKQKVVTKAFENIIEANTCLSGIGFESGGLAAAHAIHNGLTTLPESRQSLHGEVVAFSTIAQLVLENRSLTEIQKVISFCKSIGLPTCLKDLSLDKVSRKDLYQAATASIVEGGSIHNMPFPVNADDVLAAILTADQLGNNS